MANTAEEPLLFYANHKPDIYLPIKKSQRVKYTSFHVCPSFIAFGSSSGGVYLFRNDTDNECHYLFTILNADNCGPITCLAFAAHDDHLIAMATSRGHIIVAEIQPEKRGLYATSWKITYQCSSFTRQPINILKWDQYYDYRLYIGDRSGQIFILHNVKDLKNLMVAPQPTIILKLMAEIYQMEVCQDLLLLSTHSKYILYDVSGGELTQIGTKSVRSDGQSYGVCFFSKNTSTDNHIYNCIFCSRPKSRLWECDLKGTVRFTHQFKELLINQMPEKIINGTDICGAEKAINKANNNHEPSADSPTKAQPTVTFGKLCAMTIEGLDLRLIVTFANSPSTCLYVINPISGCVVSHCVLDVTHIHDIYCIDCDIYLIYSPSEDKRLELVRISLLTGEQCLKVLIESQEFINGANLVINHFEYFSSKCSISTRNRNKLKLRTDKLVEQLWTNLQAEDKHQFLSIQQLIIGGMSREKSFLIDESQELSLNSIDSNASDAYNTRHSDIERLYYDMSSQYSDPTLDVVNTLDVGFSELKKLKDIVLSKLNTNQNQIEFATDSLQPEVRATDVTERQLENNNYLNDNKEFNLSDNKSSDDNDKRHELESGLRQMESQLKESRTLEQFRCDCDSPLPGSHLTLCELQERIRKFLIENTEYLEYSVIDLLDICKRNAIWSLYMKLLLKCQEYHQYLRSSVMLNDLKCLLQTDFIDNYLSNVDHFEQLLNLFSRQRDAGSDLIVRCPQCDKSLDKVHNSITWETIIRFCVNTVGVEEAFELLDKFIDQKPVFSVDFYLVLLRMRMISVHQSPVTRDKLNRLISHLNSVSKARSPLSPLSPFSTRSSSPLIPSVSSLTTNQSKGFKVNLSGMKCAKCETSLVTRGQRSGPKLVAFYCKHVYHKMCLNSEHNYCIICMKKTNK